MFDPNQSLSSSFRQGRKEAADEFLTLACKTCRAGGITDDDGKRSKHSTCERIIKKVHQIWKTCDYRFDFDETCERKTRH